MSSLGRLPKENNKQKVAYLFSYALMSNCVAAKGTRRSVISAQGSRCVSGLADGFKRHSYEERGMSTNGSRPTHTYDCTSDRPLRLAWSWTGKSKRSSNKFLLISQPFLQAIDCVASVTELTSPNANFERKASLKTSRKLGVVLDTGVRHSESFPKKDEMPVPNTAVHGELIRKCCLSSTC